MIDIADRLELFVDGTLIDRMAGARLKLGTPQRADTAIRFDNPWEGRWAGGATVLHDTDRFRMIYRGMPSTGDGTNVECTCYAESADGITWTKPNLGLYDYQGIKDNNIIVWNQPPASGNFCPFIDRRPGVPDDERYKAMSGNWRKGIKAYVSPDAIHWRELHPEPVLTADGPCFDSQNVPFWSETEGCYVFYFRTFHPHPASLTKHGFRWVSRAVSDDFIHWSEWVEMDAGDAPWEEIYTQQTHPYFRAPHIYISLAARFWPTRKVLTDEQARAADVHPDYDHDCSDAVLMSSRGGNRYDRTFLESFVRPGIGHGHWVSRTNYPALGVIPTGPAEMSLYATRHYAQVDAYLDRFTLRTDGFASLSAGYDGGEMTTKPLTFSGAELEINYATSAAGSVRVEIQDETGRAVPGHTLDDCPEIIGDEIERVVAWSGGPDVSRLAGETVRLRFVLKDADLYALRFRP